MLLYSQLLVIVCIFGAFGASVAQNCSQDQLDNCFAPLQKYLQLDKMLQSILQAQASDINAECIDLVEVITCIDNTNCIGSVDLFTRLKLLGVRSFVLYACNEGKQDIVQYQNCFLRPGFYNQVLSCTSGVSGYSCSLYQNQLNCLVNITRAAKCASDEVVVKVYTKFVQPEMSYNVPYCLLNQPPGMPSGSVPRGCNNYILDSCLKDLRPYFFPWTLKVTQQQITEGCSILQQTTTCVNTHSSCTESDSSFQVYWAGYQDVLSHICNVGNKAFLQYQTCFDKPGFINDLQECATLRRPINATDSSRWCTFYKNEMNCYANLESYGCTTKDVVIDFYVRLVQPRFNILLPGCKLRPSPAASGFPKTDINYYFIFIILIFARIAS